MNGKLDLVVIGAAPSQAMALVYETAAASIGLAMQNAVSNQQNMQTITSAAVAQAVALILKQGSG